MPPTERKSLARKEGGKSFRKVCITKEEGRREQEESGEEKRGRAGTTRREGKDLEGIQR
jgi:hypothetical protein